MGKPFTVNMQRYLPFPKDRFLLYLGGSTSACALLNKISGIKRTSEVNEYKEGGNPIILKGPGRTKYEAITLERGVTFDRDFVNWANAVQVLDKGAPSSSLKNLRQEVRIDLLNEAGQPVWRCMIHRAWVSEYQALPDLDAGASGIAIEHIKLENEGWEQDLSLAEVPEV